MSINPDLIICPHQNLVEWLSYYLCGHLVKIVNGDHTRTVIEIRQAHPEKPDLFRIVKTIPVYSTAGDGRCDGKVVIGQPPISVAAKAKSIHIFESNVPFERLQFLNPQELKEAGIHLVPYKVTNLQDSL